MRTKHDLFVDVFMLLTWQDQSQVSQVEGPGQAVGYVLLPPLADVWHLHLRRTLHANHRNSRNNVTTLHLCSGATWHPAEGARRKKRASSRPGCPFPCGTNIFLGWIQHEGQSQLHQKRSVRNAMVIVANEDMFRVYFYSRNAISVLIR